MILFDESQDISHWQEKCVYHNKYLCPYEALDDLSLQLKTVVILHFYKDRKLEEIAKITSTTNLGTVKTRLYKALGLMKIYLGGGQA